jgi:protein SCO1/2
MVDETRLAGRKQQLRSAGLKKSETGMTEGTAREKTMKPKSEVNVLAMKLALMAALAATLLPAAATADGQRWGANYFPNVELITQDGKAVHFYDDLIKGKVVVIDLIYTHCVDSCPLETARLVQVQKLLGDAVGKEIFFYSITIDPKRDTPEVLKDYSEKYHVGPGWTFLTGKKADIDMLSKKLGLYQDPDPNDRDGHMAAVLIGNEPAGQWMRNAATDNPRFLANLIGDRFNNWKLSAAKKSSGTAQAQKIDIDQGRYLFATQCAACHTIGHGDKIGPDLQGVADIRDPKWLKHFIRTPDQMVTDGDPIATALFTKYKQVRMPNLRMADEDIDEVIDFMKKQSKAPDGPATVSKDGTAPSTQNSPAGSLSTSAHH